MKLLLHVQKMNKLMILIEVIKYPINIHSYKLLQLMNNNKKYLLSKDIPAVAKTLPAFIKVKSNVRLELH